MNNMFEAEEVKDERLKILDYVKVSMIDDLTKEQMNKLNYVLLNCLSDYQITRQCTELCIYEDNNEQALKMFVGIMKMKGKQDNTIKQYIDATRNCLSTIGKNYTEITEIDMMRYFALLSTKVSKVTFNNYVHFINPFFSYMSKKGYIKMNPMSEIETVKTDYIEKKPFKQSELDCLRDNTKTIRDRALIEFLYSTGCRISEALSLDIENIVNDECVVFGKGSKERVCFLNDSAKYYLNMYLNSRKDDNKALFVTLKNSSNGQPTRLKKCGAECMLRRLGETCGIEKVHPHRYRRTNCCTLLSRGVGIEDVQKMLGHSNIATTVIYTSMNKDNIKYKHHVSL